MTTKGDDHSSQLVRTTRRIGVALLLTALLVRGYVCFRNVDSYSADPDAYRRIAETLGVTGVFGLTTGTGEAIPTAFRPPLYPYFLSWFLVDESLPNLCVAAFHTILGGLTVLWTYLACFRLLGLGVRSCEPSVRSCEPNVRSCEPNPGMCGLQSARAGSILAAIAVIVDPILLQQSTLLMTETLATAIVTGTTCWWVCRVAPSKSLLPVWILGVLLGMAFLCRPTFLVWAGLLCLRLAIPSPIQWKHLHWKQSASQWKRAVSQWRNAAAASLVVAVTVGVWTIRNHQVIGHPVWATTHGGYTLLLGNNPSFYDYLRSGEAGTTWDADEFIVAYTHRYDGDPTSEAFWKTDWDNFQSKPPSEHSADITEHDDDRLVYESAKATILRQPKMFFWSCGVRLYRLWTPLPHRTPGRSQISIGVIGLYYTLFYVAVFVGLWKLGRRVFSLPWWPIPAMVLTLSLVHAIYWSNIRMRAPAIPLLAIVAAAAVCRSDERATSA